MFSLVSACKRLGVLACLGACPVLSWGQGASFSAQGGEYPLVGSLAGDQVFPQATLNPYGGYLVWQDNRADGDGFGISAQRVNRSLSGSYGVFRVNEQGAGDQTLPQAALLSGGGAVFVWQSTVGSATKVYARFVKADGTFATSDVLVSSYATDQQLTPVVTGLPDGNAFVAWASAGEDSSMLGVFGQRFSPTGDKLGVEFQINQTRLLNQRSPALATLANGNVVVVWVSESAGAVAPNYGLNGQPNPVAGVQLYNVDVYGRLYDPNGTAVAGEFKINSSATVCANPCLSASGDGFLVGWSGKPNQVTVASQLSDGWDIYARAFSVDGKPKQADFKVNTYTYGDQYVPKASYVGGLHFVLWTSLGQDGSDEGVVARLVSGNGDPVSREFRVNTTVVGAQGQPTVASTGGQDFLCIWSSFVGGAASVDLFAQRYSVSQSLSAPPAPFVNALSQSKLSVTWPELAGFTGVQYLVYMDQSTTPVTVSNNQWTAANLQPSSSHSFRLAYKLADGRQSALSDAATTLTWGEDGNFDGLPDDWQAKYWGSDPAKWPAATLDSDGDGASNVQEFLAGTDPNDPASVLRTKMTASAQGWRLEWNTEPGFVYQVQIASDDLTWSSMGSVRLAAGKSDSIAITGDTNVAVYRVIRVR